MGRNNKRTSTPFPVEGIRPRKINTSKKYDRFFVAPRGQDQRFNTNHPLHETLRMFPQFIKWSMPEVREFAKEMEGRNLRETCSNLWHFCYEYIQYRPDDWGMEQVRSPNRIYAERFRGVDCDCYTNLIAACLAVLQVPGITLRVTKYPDPEGKNLNPSFSHIYVIVPDGKSYLTIDPVMPEFDFEAPFIDKIDKKMSLHYLNGPGGNLKGFDAADMLQEDVYQSDLGSAKPKRSLLKAKQQGQTPKAIQAGFQRPDGSIDWEGYQKHVQAEYQRQNGQSFDAHFRQQQAAHEARRRQHANQQQKEIEAMRRELNRRGVANAHVKDHGELIRLLNANPSTGKGLNFINKVNKFNPATALVRFGALASIGINYLGIGKALLIGRLDDSTARKNPRIIYDKYKRVRNVYNTFAQAFFVAGGKKENLKKTLDKLDNRLRSKGKSLYGFPSANALEEVLGPEVVASELPRQVVTALNGLGEPISLSAGIAAATAILTAAATAIKAIGSAVQGQPDADSDPDTVTEIEQFETREVTALIDPTGLDLPSRPDTGLDPNVIDHGTTTVPMIPESGNPLSPESGADKVTEKFLFWVKAKPVQAGLSLLGVLLLGGGAAFGITKAVKGKKSTSLKGVPSTTRKKTNSRSKKPTTRRQKKALL